MSWNLDDELSTHGHGQCIVLAAKARYEYEFTLHNAYIYPPPEPGMRASFPLLLQYLSAKGYLSI